MRRFRPQNYQLTESSDERFSTPGRAPAADLGDQGRAVQGAGAPGPHPGARAADRRRAVGRRDAAARRAGVVAPLPATRRSCAEPGSSRPARRARRSSTRSAIPGWSSSSRWRSSSSSTRCPSPRICSPISGTADPVADGAAEDTTSDHHRPRRGGAKSGRPASPGAGRSGGCCRGEPTTPGCDTRGAAMSWPASPSVSSRCRSRSPSGSRAAWARRPA